MKNKEYQSLCDAIRHKCMTQQWYGPEFRSPTRAYMVAEDDPRRVGFKFPPATEEELRETETILGFSLPSILRALYTQVANGDFGPAYGLRGVIGGAPEKAGTIAAWYKIRAEVLKFFNLGDSAIQQGKDFTFSNPFWPRSLLSICDWGCGTHIGVDCVTNSVVRIEPLEDGYCLIYLTDSLEKWLHQWIRGELYPQRIISAKEALIAERLLRGEQPSDYF